MAEPSLPDGWTALTDSKGRTYYSCYLTRETTWNRPSPPVPSPPHPYTDGVPQQRPPPPPYSGSDAGAPAGRAAREATAPAAHMPGPAVGDAGAAREATAPAAYMPGPAAYMPGPAVGDAGAAREGRAPAASTRAGPTVGDAGAMGEGNRWLVLPRPPSDKEKVLYQRSGRVFLLFFAFFSAYYTCGAMVLFTISSPYFYFFGAPTVFAIVYLTCHYFGVSVWGTDFSPRAHGRVVQKAAEENYLPRVDVFLPVCGEPTELLANSWSFVQKLDYPATHLAVYVLDDGGAKDDVKSLVARLGFRYVRRPDSPTLRKAGNLRHAFSVTTAEVFVIFDADFCPRSDFLRETVPYLADNTIGIVQTPQFFSRRDEQTWVEQGAGVCQELFYRMEQVNLERFGAALCCGSCAVYRRAAVEPFGGVAAISHSEDMFTGFEMTRRGSFKVRYIPLCLATGTCPHDQQSFFLQQYRWCLGILTLVRSDGFWGSRISCMNKLCFFNGLLYYLAPALFIFLGPTPLVLLVWLEAENVFWVYVGLTVPTVFFSCVVLPCWARQDGVWSTTDGLCRQMPAHRVRVIRSYAHLCAIKDFLTGSVTPWVPSGVSRLSSSAYVSSAVLLLLWNTVSTTFILGGTIWSIVAGNAWYNFVFPVGLALVSVGLSLSTLSW